MICESQSYWRSEPNVLFFDFELDSDQPTSVSVLGDVEKAPTNMPGLRIMTLRLRAYGLRSSFFL